MIHIQVQQGRCSMKKGTVKEYPSPSLPLYPIHSHASFEHLSILCSATTTSPKLRSPLPCCKHHCHLAVATPESRRKEFTLDFFLLLTFGSSSSLYFQDLLSCFKWETSAFFSVKALAKLDTSILCLFTGQVQDRQQQSEISRTVLHSTDVCNDPKFYGG